MINKGSFLLRSRDFFLTASRKSSWILVLRSTVTKMWSTTTVVTYLYIRKRLVVWFLPDPFPPPQHITEDWKGNAKVQNNSMSQGPATDRQCLSHSYPISLHSRSHLQQQNDAPGSVLIFFQKNKKTQINPKQNKNPIRICHCSKFHHASCPCLLEQTVQHRSP